MFGDESQITLIFQCYMTFTPPHQQKVIEFSIFADFFYQCTSSRYIWWPHWVWWWCYRWAACPAIAITLFLGRSGRQTPFREIVSPTDTISSKRFFTGIFVDPLFGVVGGGGRGGMRWNDEASKGVESSNCWIQTTSDCMYEHLIFHTYRLNIFQLWKSKSVPSCAPKRWAILAENLNLTCCNSWLIL